MSCTRSLSLLIFTAALGACASATGQAMLQTEEGDTASARLTLNTPYVIQPTLAATRCLMPLGGAQDNGTPVVLADCNGSRAQAWVRTGDHDDLVVFGSKCLDVADGANTNGARLQLWDCAANNDNQRWLFTNNQLVWSGKNKCIDVPQSQFASDSTPLQLWDCIANSDSQLFQFGAPTAAQAPAVGTGSTYTSPEFASGFDTSTLTSAFDGTWSGVPLQQDGSVCLAVVSFPDDLRLTTTGCQGGVSQTFGFDPNGRILFPSQTTAMGATTYQRGAYCLGLGNGGGGAAGTIPQFVPCNSADADQVWGKTQTALVLMHQRKCLSRAVSSSDPTAVLLSTCGAQADAQWVIPN